MPSRWSTSGVPGGKATRSEASDCLALGGTATPIERMPKPGPQARGARLAGVEGPPPGTVALLAEPLGRDGKDLLGVHASKGCGAIVAAHPPGLALFTDQAVEHELLADLDEGDIAAARLTSDQANPVPRLEERAHRQPAGTDLDTTSLERALDALAQLPRIGHGLTVGATPGSRGAWAEGPAT